MVLVIMYSDRWVMMLSLTLTLQLPIRTQFIFEFPCECSNLQHLIRFPFLSYFISCLPPANDNLGEDDQLKINEKYSGKHCFLLKWVYKWRLVLIYST